MSDIQQIGSKIGITSPRVLRKAEEFVQLLEIRSNSGGLSALKLPAGCTTVACIDLAASTCNHYADKAV
ncbi:hypothetical protein DPMN_174802 [Dreissena polymorpha]|uniref:Uncharacterized protein n=1 Tax=Dreissena polymorpha TaxID=45954 RepID=A0A9D4E6Z2_DREPO|nr:hypothetical protein DPMN_174802 [Dreissena polymorpha]